MISAHIQIVAQLLRFNVWNKENKKTEEIYSLREKIIIILSYVNFEKLYNVMKFFLNWIKSFSKNVLLLFSCTVQEPLNGKKTSEWIITICGKIDTRTYHDFTIDKSYFNKDSIFTIVNEMRMTRSDLFERQYKHRRKFHYLVSQVTWQIFFNILRINILFYHFYIEY